MGLKKITINDVAAEAGVSYQTVSRVLNNRPDVSEETRKRVQTVIKTLGFRPSAAARTLVSSKTHILGLITADFSDYFFTQVIVGAEDEVRRHGYFLMLSSTERNPLDEPEYLRMLTEQRIEGVLFARPSTELERNNPHILSLLDKRIPVVMTAFDLQGDVMVVDVDNVSGGLQATQHLIDYGHRAIAMIAGPDGWRSVNERAQGYRQALQAAGLPLETSLIQNGDWTYESGFAAAQALLESRQDFSAVFAHNDQMAIGATSAFQSAGRAIPDDIAIVGYDDIPVARYYAPPLTTIRQPMQDVGRVAARMLIDAINNLPLERQEVLLTPELVIRQSSGQRR